jgi:hypothetical protein
MAIDAIAFKQLAANPSAKCLSIHGGDGIVLQRYLAN